MSRRSLVIAAVFLGAVALLLFLGHLGRKPASSDWPLLKGRRSEGNKVVIPLWDPKKARKFYLRADLKEDSVFVLGQTAEEQTIAFGKGEVTVPFELPSEKGKGTGTFQLEFSEATYRGIPGLSRSARISLPAPCTGILNDGVSRTTIECASLNIDWRSTQHMTLETKQPVRIHRDKPELILEGTAGFTGRFSDRDNEYVLRFPAPVRAWLTRTAGETVLSLSPAPEGQSGGYLCIQCETPGGGLVIDWGNNTITFDRRVVVSPTTKPQVPPKRSARRFECHRLVLSINPTTKSLIKAEAERGPDTTVRGFWDTVTVEGGKAVWETRAETAVLTGAPHLWGKTDTLRFDAEAEVIQFDTKSHVATLKGPIKSNLEHTALPERLNLPGFWILTADRAEVAFASAQEHRITAITASADPTLPVQQGVRFESLPQGSIVATGGKLTYKISEEILTVEGLPGQAPYLEIKGTRTSRPDLTPRSLLAFRLAAWAKRVRFSFADGSVYLEEQVNAKVVRTTREAAELTDRLRAHKLKLTLEEDAADFAVEAWGRDLEAPLTLDYDGPPRVRLEGGHLIWERSKGLVRVLPQGPITRQVITFLTGKLSSRKLEFKPEAAQTQALAHGGVEAEIATDYGPVKLNADHAELTVDSTLAKAEGPPALNALKHLTVWSDGAGHAELRHKKLSASATRATYDATKGIILLGGQGIQTFSLVGPAGSDDVHARSVKFIPQENRLSLSGGVSGIIHQGNWSAEPALSAAADGPRTPWRYEADSAEIQLRRLEERWEVTGLTATGSVRLRNDELRLTIEGDRLTFDSSTRTIVLGSEAQGGGIQTIRFGTPPRQNLLSGRKITVTRRERLEDGLIKPEVTAVLTRDVRCLFYLRELPNVKNVPEYAPEKFEVSADKVVLVVPTGHDATRGLISYAHATGNVMFQGYKESGAGSGAPYQGFGSQAYYTSVPLTFLVLGDGKGQPANVRTPLGNVVSQVIQLRQRPDRTLEVRYGPGVEYHLPRPFRALPAGSGLSEGTEQIAPK